MFKLINGFLIALTLTSTNFAFAGSVSGGGGGTLPANPVSIFHIFDIVKEAKRDLRMFIKYEQWGNGNGTMSGLDQKLYGGPKTMWDAIETMGIELRMDKPCYDANNNEVDGSIYATNPGDICISAFSIAPKLIEERAQIETLALIIHELTHVLGADEAEAVEYQQRAAYFLKQVDVNTTRFMAEDGSDRAYQISGSLEAVAKKAETAPASEIASDMQKVNVDESAFNQKSLELPFSLHNNLESDYLRVQEARLLVSLWYTLKISNADNGYWGKMYDELFNGQKSITYAEFLLRHFGGHDSGLYANEVIVKIETAQELKGQLVSLFKYYVDEGHYIFQLARNLALPKSNIPGNTTPNPWENFVGKYEVVSKNCVNNGFQPGYGDSLVGFTVHHPDYDQSRLYLRQEYKNGWGDNGVYDGAGDVMGGSEVSVSGDQNSVTRFAEFGTSWSENWRQHIYTLSKTNQGFFMVEKLLDRRWDSRQTKRYSLECTYQLKQVSQ